jgi:hypothetical protein
VVVGAKRLVLVTLLAAGLSACTGGSPPRDAAHLPAQAPADVLYVPTGSGLRALDAATGRTIFSDPQVIPAPDWSVLVSSSFRAGETSVKTVDPATGQARMTHAITGHLVASAVSGDAMYAAMVDPGADSFPAVPTGRAVTHIDVVGLGAGRDVRRFQLRGNYQPEAFSMDDRSLYLIKYLPAMAPDRYRVMSLDLVRGRVYPAPGRTKVPTGAMTGSRVVHVFAPDGGTLFTLYTNQYGYAKESPSIDGSESDSTPGDSYGVSASSSQRWSKAFVHTLSLDYGFAICVNLPKAFGSGSPSPKTLALSPDGSHLYVVDARLGLIATIDTKGPRLAGTTHVDFGSGRGTAMATTGLDDTLYVGWGNSVTAIDTASMKVREQLSLGQTVTGLGVDRDGTRLYVALGNRIATYEASTGAQLASFGTPGVYGISSVGSTD